MEKGKGMEKKERITIFPLSPDPELENGSDLVYFKYLDAACGDRRVKNMAITGGFGVGKSSIICSYETAHYGRPEKRWPQWINRCKLFLQGLQRLFAYRNREKGYLYISLGAFLAPDLSNQSDESSKESINAIEQRLLLQIYTRFHRKDLPLSRFHLVQEESKRQRWLTSFLFGLFTCMALLLCFYGEITELLETVNDVYSNSRLKWATPFLKFSVKNRELLHLVLLLLVIVFVSIVASRLCSQLLMHFHLRNISVKAVETAEFSIEKSDFEGYIDTYSMELVYCLEHLVDQIRNVVVFEDLDRFPQEDCLYILTRLREINYLVNLRIAPKGKKLLFIYAINDRFLDKVEHTKFFDYILPAISPLNKRSSVAIIEQKLDLLNKELCKNNETVTKAARFPHINLIAPYLDDYRIQDTILNEYRLLADLYWQNSQALDKREMEALLAFSIYKNFWPEDYYQIRKNNSKVFTDNGIKCPESFKNVELLKILTNPEDPLLTLHGLFYAGYSERAVSDRFLKYWQAEDTKPEWIALDLRTIRVEDKECLAKAREFLEKRSFIKKESQKPCVDETEKLIIESVELCRAAIECMVRCGQIDNDWFFRGHSPMECITVLAALNEEKDASLKNRFIEMSDLHGRNNIFSDGQISSLRKISRTQLTELCRGIFPFPNLPLTVDGEKMQLTEGCDLIQAIRMELKQERTYVE